MLRKILFASMVSVCFFQSNAQDSSVVAPASSGPTISGSVDGYYRFNVANPKSGSTNNYTSFTNSQNSFELGMASVRADHSLGKASATVDLGFGRRAEEFSYGDPDYPTLFAVKQAYLSYAVSDKLKLTMGKWATHVGFELVDAYLNKNYSMAYMFSYGPFAHTGLKADIGLGGKSALMLGVSNTTDIVSTTTPRKFAIAQFSTGSKDDVLKAYLNYQGSYGGSFNTSQFDLVLLGTITDKFSVGYNGTVQSFKPDGGSSDSWWGSALYLTAAPQDNFNITLRAEYFDNKKEVVFAPPTGIIDITLSPNFKIGNLTIIPELRLDTGKDAIFEKNDGTFTKSSVSAILAATYHF